MYEDELKEGTSHTPSPLKPLVRKLKELGNRVNNLEEENKELKKRVLFLESKIGGN